MSIPPQASVFDERRNTSRVIKAPPGAVDAALNAIRAYVRKSPKHVRWLLEGHPTMTHEEHYERFGQPYKHGELS